jgi:hypothetical protein
MWRRLCECGTKLYTLQAPVLQLSLGFKWYLDYSALLETFVAATWGTSLHMHAGSVSLGGISNRWWLRPPSDGTARIMVPSVVRGSAKPKGHLQTQLASP